MKIKIAIEKLNGTACGLATSYRELFIIYYDILTHVYYK